MSEMKRVIKLKLLSQNELVKVETSARTFGEFKAEVANLEIDWTSVKLIDRASKVSYSELDAAVLPATDAIMFVMPTKSKAGADLSYKEAKEAVKQYKLNGGNVPFNYTNASTEQLNKFLAGVNATQEVAKEVEEGNAPETIFLKPGVYTLVVEGDEIKMGEEVELVDETTLDDLQAEAEALKKVLK